MPRFCFNQNSFINSGAKMSSLLITYILSALFVLIFLTKYYWERRKLFYHGSKFDGPTSWPLIGCIPTIISNSNTNFVDNVLKIPLKYKSPFKLYIGHSLYFFLTKPKDMEVLLNSPNALEKGGIYKLTKSLFGNGVMTAPATIWKRNRKILSPAFNTKILSSYQQIFVEKSQKLVDNLGEFANGDFFDVFPVMQQKSLEINCMTNLGEEQKGGDFTKKMTLIFEIFAKRMFNLLLHSDTIFEMTSLAKIVAKCQQDVNDFSEKAIIKKRENYQKNIDNNNDSNEDGAFARKTLRKPFLERLVEISMTGANFTNKEIIDEVNTLIMAGSDSVASTICFVLMMLGMHQDAQEKTYEEISENLGDPNKPVEFEDLSKLKYLERVIKETLRIFPPAVIIMRSITEDIHLDSGVLPKGSSGCLLIMHTHRDPEIWSEPLKFDPDRFLPENFEKIPPYAYLPFSGGPRNCLGMKYAMFLMKTILATVLRKYKVKNCHQKSVDEVKLTTDLLLKASDGYKISIEKRPTSV